MRPKCLCCRRKPILKTMLAEWTGSYHDGPVVQSFLLECICHHPIQHSCWRKHLAIVTAWEDKAINLRLQHRTLHLHTLVCLFQAQSIFENPHWTNITRCRLVFQKAELLAFLVVAGQSS